MKEIIVDTVDKKYSVYIDNNINKFHTLFEKNRIKISEKIFIVTDRLVYELYKDIIEHIKSENNCKIFCIAQGEKEKNIYTIQNLYDFLLENDANKNSTIIAFGGGTVGDLAGFVASTYMGGIKLVNVPTTLLSQVDSCIGGKVRFNYGNVKDLIGNFYNPIFVYVCTRFLKTLSNKEFKNGLGEVVKYGVIGDVELLNFINLNYKYILERENDKLGHIVKECLRIKSEVLFGECRNKGLTNVLDFGHIIAYGIEMSSKFTVSYGEAVGLGMLVSIKLSQNKFNIPLDTYGKVESILKKLSMPVKYKVDNYSSFMYAINHDKKNNDKLKFVLLEDNERCKAKVEVSEEEIKMALKESINRG
ncbi:3-dehydroquinate synthase [Clostridium carboxidivorans P7]|uniref:3-dehydroquinate synthase n=1 Tax=Clostridium carboxidivorans P7 TaxID=536227 RepID=C6Q1P8_9CLOT|nr:3-dehydroquinate synthase family protein [Clostridium carboxidivorans]AKN33995.1 3-dehydroquinate synthase [Clostridium carboxidivorans P7]EET84590.1 3-dehydroquinate synthase [Clostridium carboxidivorans P7]EFG88131.1 putative 3-dehydroquinate synthase [Clostridium carboxidivorans P7]